MIRFRQHLLGTALLLHRLEDLSGGWFASMVAIMAIGFYLLARHEHAAHEEDRLPEHGQHVP